VQKGAAFAIGTDYRRVGVLTADVAAKVLLQKKPVSDVDILDISEGSIYVNSRSPVAVKIAPHGKYNIVGIQ